MVADRIRSMTGWHWIVLFGGVLFAWVAVFAMAVPGRDEHRVHGAGHSDHGFREIA